MAASKAVENGIPIQFLGSGYINRQSDGISCKCSPDAVFVPNLLPDLKYSEGEIEVDCTICLEQTEGAIQMWCFGRKTRCISLTKPELCKMSEESDTYKNLNSYMYLDRGTRTKYFTQIPDGIIFPVYVKVNRI